MFSKIAAKNRSKNRSKYRECRRPLKTIFRAITASKETDMDTKSYSNTETGNQNPTNATVQIFHRLQTDLKGVNVHSCVNDGTRVDIDSIILYAVCVCVHEHSYYGLIIVSYKRCEDNGYNRPIPTLL